MIAHRVRARSGITLTEILISILIMGIGLISLATLFPLGLIRLRDAARFQRSGILVQSATDDFDARALLYKKSFSQTWYGPVDPFTTDSTYGGFGNPVTTDYLATGIPQPGLMVCYDPLWRSETNVVPPTANANNAPYDSTLTFSAVSPYVVAEARFGAGIVGGVNAFSIRSGTSDNGTPSAYGLQRLTNFMPWNSGGYTPLYPFTCRNNALGGIQPVDVAGDVFTSIDDIVFNASDGAVKGTNPLVPDLTLSGDGTPSNDWKYTWFFTGRQVDSTNGTMFQGDIVICDGRQLAFMPLPAPNSTLSVPVGETVVEAIFGYSTSLDGNGFAIAGDRTVLLRWPTTIADPSIRLGSWFADVTYERDMAKTKNAALTGKVDVTKTPFQRANWYQVVKRTDPQDDPDFPGTYRRMIVNTSSPVRAKTQMASGGVPNYVNVAVIMPSVINVYPRSFTIH